MDVIYEPKGRAKEYAPLACNLYMGCTHGCKYCYAPSCMHKKPNAWHRSAHARAKDILDRFEQDVVRMEKAKDVRRVLFCFLSDPYQPLEKDLRITRQAIEIAARHGVRVDILTKGNSRLIARDLPLMAQTGVHLGITLSFSRDTSRRQWEPNASTVRSRLSILRRAHEMGVYTWVSMEPVIIPQEALDVIEKAHQYVDFWKVGKLNHNKEEESKVDWPKFRDDVIARLEAHGCDYYIKDDLRRAS